MTAADVMAEVLEDKIFYDTSGGGLTVTGGEPSYQAKFTLEILAAAKDAGISAAIETSEAVHSASEVFMLFCCDN